MPRYAHLIVTAAPTAHRFTSTRSARQHFDTPQRNRPQHATRLIGQLGHAAAQAGQTVQVGNGFYTVNDLTITVQSDPNFPLAFESLDLPASGINLLAVTRDAAGRTRANRELEIINEEWEKAPACEFVFTYEVRHGPDAGKRRPITVAGLRRATSSPAK